MKIAPLFLLLFLAPSVHAQTQVTLGGGVGVGSIDDDTRAYLLLSGGAGHTFGSFLGFADFNLGIGAGNEDGRFEFDSSVDRCRDGATGRFARDEQCSNAEYYVSVSADVNYQVADDGPFVGLGFQLGEPSSPYLSGGFDISSASSRWRWLVKGGFWPDLIFLKAVLVL